MSSPLEKTLKVFLLIQNQSAQGAFDDLDEVLRKKPLGSI
jgi:hypothetical protein